MKTAAILFILLVAVDVNAQTVHQLPATPTTVAYGYYWSEAKPALRIKSGDIVEVETMLTNTPAGLERFGVKPSDIPQALRDIVAQDTGSLRGPGTSSPDRFTSKALIRVTCWKSDCSRSRCPSTTRTTAAADLSPSCAGRRALASAR